jgi:hypothetical protein
MRSRIRAKAPLLKSVPMTACGMWGLGSTVWHAATGVIPVAQTMGSVSAFALAAAWQVIRHKRNELTTTLKDRIE